LATLAGAGGVALWASETTLATFTGDLPTFQVVALAFAVAALPSPLVWRLDGAGFRTLLRQPAGAWLLTVPSLVGYHACIYHALREAPAAPAAVLQGCTPLLIVVGSMLLPGERVRWWHLAGTALGFAGVVTLVAREDAAAGPGDGGFYLALVAVAAGMWGLYSVLTRAFCDVPTAAMGLFYAAAALAAGAAHLAFESWVQPSATEWAAVVALGLLPMGLALYLWDFGVKRGDLPALSGLSYAEPFLGAVLVVACGLGEPDWFLFWAGVLVVGGAALAARDVWDQGSPAAEQGDQAPRPSSRAAPGSLPAG
jgi:drug/metabolite transporter (DMT)-like permease